MKQSLSDWIYNNQFGRIIITFIIGVAFGVIFYGTYKAHTQTQVASEPIIKTEYVYIEKEPEVITEYVYVEKEPELVRNITQEDEWYYKDLAMREAEGEGVEGMLWVFYTVECRTQAFGSTVGEEWAGNAFYTSYTRTGKTPNENCEKAFEIFREGWTPRPLYFRRGAYHGFGTPLAQFGNHYFSSK